MKILIFLLIFVLGFALLEDSFGQRGTAPQEDSSLPEVSLQMLLRNSDGKVVTYIEPTTMYITYKKLVHEYLDAKENKKIIQKDGEMFEEIQWESTTKFKKSKQIATYGIWYEDKFVLVFRHDAYVSSPGDTLSLSWKIVRTIQ